MKNSKIIRVLWKNSNIEKSKLTRIFWKDSDVKKVPKVPKVSKILKIKQILKILIQKIFSKRWYSLKPPPCSSRETVNLRWDIQATNIVDQSFG